MGEPHKGFKHEEYYQDGLVHEKQSEPQVVSQHKTGVEAGITEE